MSSAVGSTLNYIEKQINNLLTANEGAIVCKQKLTRSRTEITPSKRSPSTSLEDFHCVLSELEGAALYFARSCNRNSQAYFKDQCLEWDAE